MQRPHWVHVTFGAWIASCTTPPPSWNSGHEASITAESTGPGLDPWPELDPPASSGSSATVGSSSASSAQPGGDDEGVSGEAPTDLPTEPAEPLRLRIDSLAFDPPGRDGAPEGPEWVVLVHEGPEPMALQDLRVRARDWPTVDLPRLEEAVGPLPTHWPGHTPLILARFDAGEPLPAARSEGEAWLIPFAHGSGLRNADGALLVEDGLGGVSDAVTWGEPDSEPPYAGEGAWLGPGVLAPSGAMCRVPEVSDSDSAVDWVDCDPGLPALVSEPYSALDEPADTQPGVTG